METSPRNNVRSQASPMKERKKKSLFAGQSNDHGKEKSKHKIEFEIGLKLLSGFADGANGLTLTLEWKESGSKVNRGQTAVRMVKKCEIEWMESLIFTSKLNFVNGKYQDLPLLLVLRKVSNGSAIDKACILLNEYCPSDAGTQIRKINFANAKIHLSFTIKATPLQFGNQLVVGKATSASDHKVGIAGQEFATISAKDLTETNNQDPSHTSSEEIDKDFWIQNQKHDANEAANNHNHHHDEKRDSGHHPIPRGDDGKLRELLAIKEKEITAQQMRIENLLNQDKKNQKKLKEVKLKLLQSSGPPTTQVIDHEKEKQVLHEEIKSLRSSMADLHEDSGVNDSFEEALRKYVYGGPIAMQGINLSLKPNRLLKGATVPCFVNDFVNHLYREFLADSTKLSATLTKLVNKFIDALRLVAVRLAPPELHIYWLTAVFLVSQFLNQQPSAKIYPIAHLLNEFHSILNSIFNHIVSYFQESIRENLVASFSMKEAKSIEAINTIGHYLALFKTYGTPVCIIHPLVAQLLSSMNVELFNYLVAKPVSAGTCQIIQINLSIVDQWLCNKSNSWCIDSSLNDVLFMHSTEAVKLLSFPQPDLDIIPLLTPSLNNKQVFHLLTSMKQAGAIGENVLQHYRSYATDQTLATEISLESWRVSHPVHWTQLISEHPCIQ